MSKESRNAGNALAAISRLKNLEGIQYPAFSIAHLVDESLSPFQNKDSIFILQEQWMRHKLKRGRTETKKHANKGLKSGHRPHSSCIQLHQRLLQLSRS